MGDYCPSSSFSNKTHVRLDSNEVWTMAANPKSCKKRKMDVDNVAVVVDNHGHPASLLLQQLHQQWQHQEEGALVWYALSFLDVKTLVQQKSVNQIWRNLCKNDHP
jgi:hypothetical protein